MSILTEALERILNSLQRKFPSVDFFPTPGLSRERVLQMTEKLPFKLSEEVYELYQWRNGSWCGFFPFLAFHPLERALAEMLNGTVELIENRDKNPING